MAVSKWLRAAGLASHTKLGVSSVTAITHSGELNGKALAYRINAETLSKQYWLNLGLLGFLLISPRIATSRVKMPSYDEASAERAVMMTRIAPDYQRLYQSPPSRHL